MSMSRFLWRHVKKYSPSLSSPGLFPMRSLTKLLLILLLGLSSTACELLPETDVSPTLEYGVEPTGLPPTYPKLKWPPPQSPSPQTITVPGSQTLLNLDVNKDYNIVLKNSGVRQKNLSIIGGRNITIIGGSFVPTPNGNAGTVALTFQDTGDNTQNRTIHVEGVSFDMHNALFDAIALRAPTATFQFQNIRITGVHGTFDGFHGDAIQNQWGPFDSQHPQWGARIVRVYRATVTTDYQGFILNPSESADLQYVDFSVEDITRSPYFLYLNNEAGTCNRWPGGTKLYEVYIEPDHTWGFGSHGVSPDIYAKDEALECRAIKEGNTLKWPSSLGVNGIVKGGAPSGGQFVPAGYAGLGYVSPGYLPVPVD